MSNDALHLTVTDNPDLGRFEVHANGNNFAGFAAYRIRGNRMIFTHTVVTDAYEGRGVGSFLAHKALEEVRSRGLLAVPVCPFFAMFLSKRPEYAELVSLPEPEDLTV